jgi:hypothetical protein
MGHGDVMSWLRHAVPSLYDVPGPDSQEQIIDGRLHIGRAEIGRRTGLSVQAQKNLYHLRAENGHPEGVRIGRSLYFDEERIMAFYRGRLEGFRSALTEVDRSGDPDELLGIAEATRLLGFTSTSTIRGYLSRNEGYFPDPDEADDLPAGGVRRWWKRRTLWRFADQRSGRGRGGVDSNRIETNHSADPP